LANIPIHLLPVREAAEISNSPSADYTAEPLESDLFEWHFTIRGPPNSAYSEGLYHGRIVLPPSYPLRPPSFRFTTPNGRFEANREICLSISGHHEETWQPAWGIRTAIVALRSFMETDARGQLGGFDTTEAVRRRLAAESHAFRCGTCARTNADIIQESEQRARDAERPSDDVEIPKELNLGFRDELANKKTTEKTAAAAAATDKDEDDETARIAEGFVPTTPSTTDVNAAASSVNPQSSNQNIHSRPARLAQASPQAATIPADPRAVANTSLRRPSDGGVPVWIDRVIVVLVVLLTALVLKILFGV
jgi:ubiquitin-conjugating enzyme E2 J1